MCSGCKRIAYSSGEIRKGRVPEDALKYHSAAIKWGLSAVHETFWEYLPHVQPYIMVTPDIPHNAHGFFQHYMVPWMFELVGKEESDARIRAMRRMIGLRAYPNGISRLKQWSGKDAQEIQKYILGLVLGSPRLTQRSQRPSVLSSTSYISHSTRVILMTHWPT